jgi:hypothetical protein
MRGIRICLIAAIALGVAGVTGAAGPMVLTRNGDLYSAGTRDNQVVITARYADGTVSELFVPQSAAAVEDSLQVGVDENTGAVYVLWQKLTGLDSRLRMAGYLDGTWIGPRTFAGNDGTGAYNPAMLIHRSVTQIVDGTDEDGEPIVTELGMTFLHLAWWSQVSEDDPGLATYAAVELNGEGYPVWKDMEPIELFDLLPYGVGCFEFEAGDNLRHPKLFIDPQSGNPHVFATDLASCHFQILEVVFSIEDEEQEFGKRRRQIIILRHAAVIALRPDLPLARGRLVVGSGLKILMHWDAEIDEMDEMYDAVRYLELDEDGVSETRNLVLDEDLDHERAVELIRELARR